jgi:hypothetical protein
VPSPTLSFAKDIRPLFRDIDVGHMQPAGYDLSSYDDVKSKAEIIYGVVSAGTMPPPPGPVWTAETCAMFRAWIDEGCPP